jgi:hypothetical protein
MAPLSPLSPHDQKPRRAALCSILIRKISGWIFIERWLASGRVLRFRLVFCQYSELLPPGLRRTQESLAPFAPGFAGEKGWG